MERIDTEQDRFSQWPTRERLGAPGRGHDARPCYGTHDPTEEIAVERYWAYAG